MAEIAFGRRLTRWLVFRGFSQAQFAAAIGVSRASVSYWCRSVDGKIPGPKSMGKILRGLRIRIVRYYGPLPK